MQPNLNCMNCNTPVDPAEGQIVFGVFCCPTCKLVAERIIARGELELRQLQLMHREAVRVALVTGKLHLGTQNVEDMDKKSLFDAILKLQENREAHRGKVVPQAPAVLPGSSKYTR